MMSRSEKEISDLETRDVILGSDVATDVAIDESTGEANVP